MPIRHNPALVKRVLVDEPVSCLRHLSQAIFRPGDTAFTHSHEDAFEVFYCVKGECVFRVKGEEVLLKKGSCLVVEPGEAHSIEKVSKITELLFMLAER
ncbi:MAG: cupin domain-containing protein [Deltaproteobacteria bacterium]|nr:cupin domain-containing protein [Deltaproteobacteria bacterium]